MSVNHLLRKMGKKSNGLKLVLVEWVDSDAPDTGWRFLEQDKIGGTLEQLKCQSVGYLVFDGKDCKRIMPHISGASDTLQGRGDLLIPAKAIISMKELAVKK